MFPNSNEFKATLAAIASVLNDNHITWCIGASSSLYVQGVAVVPKDLDIIVDIAQFDDAYKLLKKLQPGEREEGMFGDDKYSKAPLLAATFPAEIAGFEINTTTLDTYEWEGITTTIHPLSVELEMYKKRPGKEDIVTLIEETLGKAT